MAAQDNLSPAQFASVQQAAARFTDLRGSTAVQVKRAQDAQQAYERGMHITNSQADQV